MSTKKQLEVAGLGLVSFYKRKQARSIRVTVNHSGEIRVSLPTWVPYRAAMAFVETKQDWIRLQKTGKAKHMFEHNERVGKAHRVQLMPKNQASITTRVSDTELRVSFPTTLDSKDPQVQTAVERAAIRALKKEANDLLLPRLDKFALQHEFNYRTAKIKHLKSRWGSCSSEGDIALNCFLMQLPWPLIDYVLFHELLHTRVMAHGTRFWSELDRYVVDLPTKRKAMRSFHPAPIPQD